MEFVVLFAYISMGIARGARPSAIPPDHANPSRSRHMSRTTDHVEAPARSTPAADSEVQSLIHRESRFPVLQELLRTAHTPKCGLPPSIDLKL